MKKSENLKKFIVISVLAHFVLLSALALIFRSEARVAISRFFEVSTVKVASRKNTFQENEESSKAVTSKTKTSLITKTSPNKNKPGIKRETVLIQQPVIEQSKEQKEEADNKIAEKVKSYSKEHNHQQSSLDSTIEDAYPDYSANPKPAYPLIARRRGYEGTVMLKVLVLENGKVGRVNLEKSSRYKILDSAAISAVNDWSFIPGKRNGVLLASWVKVPIKFRLSEN